jgi:hypothetical protein
MRIAQTLNIGQQAVEQGLPGSAGYSDANPGGGFGPFIGTVLSGVMGVGALLVFLYLVWGAISWITSGGDKAKTEKARNQMTQAVIGLIVLASTLVIFMLLQQFLGIEVLNFAGGAAPEAQITCNPGEAVVNGECLAVPPGFI